MKTPIVAAALCLASLAMPASAQPAAATTPLLCAGDVGVLHLYGQWRLMLTPGDGGPTVAGTLEFERHPEYADTVRGQWQADGNGTQHLLSGDITDGELVLDESTDGTHISAVWVGVPVACGQGFEGSRRAVPSSAGQNEAQHQHRFELKKHGAWR